MGYNSIQYNYHSNVKHKYQYIKTSANLFRIVALLKSPWFPQNCQIPPTHLCQNIIYDKAIYIADQHLAELSMTTAYPSKLSLNAFLQIFAAKMPYLRISGLKTTYLQILGLKTLYLHIFWLIGCILKMHNKNTVVSE